MIETVYWAHVDPDGYIVSFGQCAGQDVFRQSLAPGLTAVARPPEVTGYEPWRYQNGTWTKETNE